MIRRVCRSCGALLGDGIEDSICDACIEKDAREYAIVKEFIVSHRGASMADIYLQTKISPSTIRRFISDKRIELIL
ncbi:hypothetical protein EAL2_808p04680 (plasmid) [Peptoclostridium acidaminophilum DSM 3953]|uniref:Flagellar protein n=1 Tax=Peptoclostridium acidaminophilum DSM 3953 TaxID=1286171 RepID=W8UB06_PEPAC|nr:hypothetical protein [Peptoclostridium acidaminophilum]AHM57971.1 hypothetical protein EAL2_808p04680 [Peptoclostridium acidaminophilum DSM 3953]